MPYADPRKGVENSKRWNAEHPEQCAEAQRRYRDAGHKKKHELKKRYGLTVDQFNWMLVEQGGKCAICEKDISKRPCVDHSHITGKVRRLLCCYCNVRLEAIENPGWLEAAQKYLNDHA